MESAVIRPQIQNEAEDRYVFYCPGCRSHHWIRTRGQHPVWSWNGSLDRPSVQPSILIPLEGYRCHSFMEDGHLRFLPDCDHSLAGQRVPMIPIVW
jgi:hypothetical protein